MAACARMVCWIAVFLSFGVVTQAQSLGDVAREQKQKQAAKSSQTASKVITNDDLGAADTADDSPGTPAETAPAHHSAKSAAQWQAEIEAQKKSIANLQGQIDRLNSSIHFVEANRYWNGVQHNERQVQKQDQVERMQNQLEEQRKKLAEMQESARQDGYGNATYDP